MKVSIIRHIWLWLTCDSYRWHCRMERHISRNIKTVANKKGR